MSSTWGRKRREDSAKTREEGKKNLEKEKRGWDLTSHTSYSSLLHRTKIFECLPVKKPLQRVKKEQEGGLRLKGENDS